VITVAVKLSNKKKETKEGFSSSLSPAVISGIVVGGVILCLVVLYIVKKSRKNSLDRYLAGFGNLYV
jgi:hypothetical protein